VKSRGKKALFRSSGHTTNALVWRKGRAFEGRGNVSRSASLKYYIKVSAVLFWISTSNAMNGKNPEDVSNVYLGLGGGGGGRLLGIALASIAMGGGRSCAGRTGRGQGTNA